MIIADKTRAGATQVQFLFENHVLDADRRELRRGSELIALEPQVFDLLVYLIQNRERVVSKDDLIASVWGGRIVSEFDADQPHQRGAQGRRRQRRGATADPHHRAQGHPLCLRGRRTQGRSAASPKPRRPPRCRKFISARPPTVFASPTRSPAQGPPLVKAANWLNHLEYDWESPVWSHLLHGLAAEHRLIRYDARGNGLSDWDVDDISFDAFVRDLETVVDAAGLQRFPLLGISQGCAVSIAYAVRHPERVSHLVLYGGYARGRRKRGSQQRERPGGRSDHTDAPGLG